MLRLDYYENYGHAYGQFSKLLIVTDLDTGAEVRRFKFGNTGNFMCGMAGDGRNWKQVGKPFPPDALMAMLMGKETSTRYGATRSYLLESWPVGATEAAVERLNIIRNYVQRAAFYPVDGNNYLEKLTALLRHEPVPPTTFRVVARHPA